MSATEAEIPELAQKQPKNLRDTAFSMQKGAQALGLATLAQTLKFSAWNTNRRAKEVASGVYPSQKTGQAASEPSEPPEFDDAMRIDSDDIHYHIMPSADSGKSNGMASLVKAGMLAAAIAVPGYGLATQLPAIISAVKGVADTATPPTTDAGIPAAGDPFLGLGVRVGDPKE